MSRDFMHFNFTVNKTFPAKRGIRLNSQGLDRRTEQRHIAAINFRQIFLPSFPDQILDLNVISRYRIRSFRKTVKLSDGSRFTSLLSEFREAPAPDGHQIFPTEHLVVRAAWNYMMVTYDGSNGVHNPSFSREALLATINALK